MPQLSIFDKKHHRSNKDVTLSIGKDNRITITFRNNSWEKITKGDYIRIWVSNGKIKFADADETTEGRKYKLSKSGGGNKSVTTALACATDYIADRGGTGRPEYQSGK